MDAVPSLEMFRFETLLGVLVDALRLPPPVESHIG